MARSVLGWKRGAHRSTVGVRTIFSTLFLQYQRSKLSGIRVRFTGWQAREQNPSQEQRLLLGEWIQGPPGSIPSLVCIPRLFSGVAWPEKEGYSAGNLEAPPCHNLPALWGQTPEPSGKGEGS